MLRRRLILRFIMQIMIVGLVLITLATAILIWMFKEFESIQLKRNFSPTGVSKLIQEAEIDEQGYIISSELLKQLEADGGWLQSLDEHGNVLQSFFTPDDVPNHYNPAELIDYWLGKKPFPYSLGLWIQIKDEHTFTMLYGTTSIKEQTLEPIIQDAKLVGNTINFSDQIALQLEQSSSWVQVFTNDGVEIASWRKPEAAANFYSLQDLALRNKFYSTFGIVVDSEYDTQTGLTWIIQYPIDNKDMNYTWLPKLSPELQLMIISGLLFLASSLIAFIVLAIWYAHRFMRPIMDIVGSIQQLSQGDLSEVLSNKENKKKRRLFSEVFQSIHVLTQSLQSSRAAAIQTQAYREEWIAGVTHDMKTPLASIQGYAHMLATDKYQWSEQDVREFSAIMLEKSQYMNQLLDDLSLTYRLRSGSLPVTLTKQNMCILLYDAVNLTASHSRFANTPIEVVLPKDAKVYAEVYTPWFERIVYNIVANAILHNPAETSIIVELVVESQGGFKILFKDNGKGMEEHTAQQLFERYYRGTSTDSHPAGSGLGMAVTKELVQAMGGRITVLSEQGKGTMIILSWSK